MQTTLSDTALVHVNHTIPAKEAGRGNIGC